MADGKVGDAILFAPAFNCTEDHIKIMVDIVAEAIIEKSPHHL
jgi:adenosylmethionine-8-amino-7-oxononanoate aminotransferase